MQLSTRINIARIRQACAVEPNLRAFLAAIGFLGPCPNSPSHRYTTSSGASAQARSASRSIRTVACVILKR
jgi:hypothetical protein